MPSPRLRCVSRTGYRSLSLALLLGLPTLTFAASPVSDFQNSRELQQHFQIAAQPLSAALIAFSQQSGWQVSAESTLLTGLNSAPVDGSMSPEKALARLLRNSGLQWEVTSPESASIMPPEKALERLLIGTNLGYRKLGNNNIVLEKRSTPSRHSDHNSE